MHETKLCQTRLPHIPGVHLIDGQGEGVGQLLLILQNGLPIAPIDINAGNRVEFGINPIEAAAGKV